MTEQPEETPPESTNAVVLRGRLTATPVERVLPSGDVIVTFRVSVAREGRTPMTAHSRQRSDWVDCVVAAGRARRTVLGWSTGDRILVQGALRRRFYRAGGSSSTRLEVEAVRVRRERRTSAAVAG